jgi:molecular chaperone DnaK
VVFDPIFGSDTRLPSPGAPALVSSRRYRAAHNVGHFRFLECSRVRDGHPDGDVTPWGEVRFPFEPDLRGREDLRAVAVRRLDEGPEVEETYACAAAGSVEVTVRDLTDGFARSFTLGRS